MILIPQPSIWDRGIIQIFSGVKEHTKKVQPLIQTSNRVYNFQRLRWAHTKLQI